MLMTVQSASYEMTGTCHFPNKLYEFYDLRVQNFFLNIKIILWKSYLKYKILFLGEYLLSIRVTIRIKQTEHSKKDNL